jgi:hypothetical protein
MDYAKLGADLARYTKSEIDEALEQSHQCAAYFFQTDDEPGENDPSGRERAVTEIIVQNWAAAAWVLHDQLQQHPQAKHEIVSGLAGGGYRVTSPAGEVTRIRIVSPIQVSGWRGEKNRI